MADRLQLSVEARRFFDVSRGSLIFDTPAFAGGCEFCASLISLARWDTFRLHPLSTFLDESIRTLANLGQGLIQSSPLRYPRRPPCPILLPNIAIGDHGDLSENRGLPEPCEGFLAHVPDFQLG
jgi:hypothetical protein